MLKGILGNKSKVELMCEENIEKVIPAMILEFATMIWNKGVTMGNAEADFF